MISTIRTGIILLFFSAIIMCQPAKKETRSHEDEAIRFPLERGVNVSHWLSQSKARGEDRKNFFTKADMDFIAEIGYDHIRLPIDEEQMWDEAGNKDAEAFALLHDAIGWANDNELKVIVDLHILRSHHFNSTEKPLWTDPGARERFYQCWRDLSSELAKHPNELVAYELMNEPVADKAEDWNRLIAKATEAIRATEPQRFVVIGSNRWQSADTFDELEVPKNDPYIILSFHFYEPFLLTHHQAGWTDIGDYHGPVKYPGLLVEEAQLEAIADTILREKIESRNGLYDKTRLEAMMQKPIQKAKELNLQLYCGEWGCMPTVPRESLLAWYDDMRSILEKHDIGWTNWDYKGGFGIIDRNRDNQSIEDLIEVLMK